MSQRFWKASQPGLGTVNFGKPYIIVYSFVSFCFYFLSHYKPYILQTRHPDQSTYGILSLLLGKDEARIAANFFFLLSCRVSGFGFGNPINLELLNP